MTNLEKSEAEIRRLVPRLMKLSPGLQFRIDGKDAYITRVQMPGIIWFSGALLVEQGLRRLPFLNRAEIIGHTITLEDVLEAMRNVNEKLFSVRTDFIFCDEYDVPFIYNERVIKWQFGKPYDQQSPEVHEFVANILFNEKL